MDSNTLDFGGRYTRRYVTETTSATGENISDPYWVDAGNGYEYAVRKLTPRECFRLMDVSDADIDKIQAYRETGTLASGKTKEICISKTQQYKLAGNSIVVACLFHIFRKMFVDSSPETDEDIKRSSRPKQPSLFD